LFLLVAGLLSCLEFINIPFSRWLSTVLLFANYTSAAGSYYVGHFWSLAVEEHFYLIWPAIFLFLATIRKRLFFCVFFTLTIALWRAIDFKYRLTWNEGGAGFFWGRTDIVADGLLWGCAVALVYADPIWKKRLSQFISLPGVLYGVTLAAIMVQVLSFEDWKIRFMLLTIQAACIPLMLLGTITNHPGYLGCILESKVPVWIGLISYSLYLWQQLFLVWTDSLSIKMSFLQTFPVNVAAAFLCATISYRFIETPLIAFGHRITKSTTNN
jgi:peptidoglycan/LPS O-acetylase OafA/YrhL